MNLGYQLRAGETLEAIAGEVTYPDLTDAPIADDGLDLMNLQPKDAIISVSVLNSEAAQAAVLNGRFDDVPAATRRSTPPSPRSFSSCARSAADPSRPTSRSRSRPWLFGAR